MGLVISIICNAIALFIVVRIIPGITIDSTLTLIIAAIVIGLVNGFLKPLLQIISLPISILTLGLFALVINAFCLGIAAFLVPGFHIDGIFTAIIAALLLSIISTILGLITKPLDKAV